MKKTTCSGVKWEQVALGDVCEVIAGQSPKSSNYNNAKNGLPFYQGKKEFTSKYLGAPTKWTTHVTSEAIAGDILMSVRAPVGPINFATERICIGRGLAAIRAGEQIEPNFLFYLLLSMQDQINGSEGAVFASINKNQIQCISFRKPSLAEQKRIVAMLDEAFTAIATATENTKKNLANAQKLFDSALHSVFQPPQSAKNSVSDVTAKWRETTLGEVCDVIAGQSPKGSNYNNQGNGLSFYQGKKEFGEKFIGAPATWTTQITRESHAGDILMSVRAPVGPINFSTDHICIGRGLAAIRASNQINQEFLFYALLSMQKQIQGTEGAVFASINKMQIENLMLCFPSLPEQKRIATFLDKLSAEKQTLVDTYETKIRALAELKQSLLHQAFTGELTADTKAADRSLSEAGV